MRRKLSKIKFITVSLFTILLMMPLISAFGVTAPYGDTSPMTLNPGETQEFYIQLQNMVGGEDKTLRATVVEGKEFATLIDSSKDYLVPFGQKDIRVNVRVNIPTDTVQFESHQIAIMFREIVSDGDGKPVQLATGVRKRIPLVISATAPPKEPLPLAPGLGALLILAVLIVGYFAWWRRRE